MARQETDILNELESRVKDLLESLSKRQQQDNAQHQGRVVADDCRVGRDYEDADDESEEEADWWGRPRQEDQRGRAGGSARHDTVDNCPVCDAMDDMLTDAFEKKKKDENLRQQRRVPTPDASDPCPGCFLAGDLDDVSTTIPNSTVVDTVISVPPARGTAGRVQALYNGLRPSCSLMEHAMDSINQRIRTQRVAPDQTSPRALSVPTGLYPLPMRLVGEDDARMAGAHLLGLLQRHRDMASVLLSAPDLPSAEMNTVNDIYDDPEAVVRGVIEPIYRGLHASVSEAERMHGTAGDARFRVDRRREPPARHEVVDDLLADMVRVQARGISHQNSATEE